MKTKAEIEKYYKYMLEDYDSKYVIDESEKETFQIFKNLIESAELRGKFKILEWILGIKE